MDEMFLRRVYTRDAGMRMLGAYLYIFQFGGARREFFINKRGKAADGPVVDPHAALHQPGRLAGGDELSLVIVVDGQGAAIYRHCFSSMARILSMRATCRPPSNSVVRNFSRMAGTFVRPSSAAMQHIWASLWSRARMAVKAS